MIIRDKIEVALNVENMVACCLTWFGYAGRKPVEAPVRD